MTNDIKDALLSATTEYVFTWGRHTNPGPVVMSDGWTVNGGRGEPFPIQLAEVTVEVDHRDNDAVSVSGRGWKVTKDGRVSGSATLLCSADLTPEQEQMFREAAGL